jgi:hypothetical protein
MRAQRALTGEHSRHFATRLSAYGSGSLTGKYFVPSKGAFQARLVASRQIRMAANRKASHRALPIGSAS